MVQFQVEVAALAYGALLGRVLSVGLLIVTVVVSSSPVLTGLFVDHAPPRLLAAVCRFATLLYAAVWRAAYPPVGGWRDGVSGAIVVISL